MYRAAILALCLGAASAFVAPKAPAAKSLLKADKGDGYYSKYSLFPPFYEPSEEYASDFGAPSSGVWDPLGVLYGADQV